MRTSTFPNVPPSFARSLAALAIALTSGLAGAGQAFAASAPPATSMSVSVADGSRGVAAATHDWNVDYPSQIGPEGPASANARSVARPIPAGATQVNADVALQTVER